MAHCFEMTHCREQFLKNTALTCLNARRFEFDSAMEYLLLLQQTRNIFVCLLWLNWH